MDTELQVLSERLELGETVLVVLVLSNLAKDVHALLEMFLPVTLRFLFC